MSSILRRVIFNLWYFRRPPWDSGISPPELMDYLDTKKPGRALDLGCGTGTNVITMAKKGWQVTGVDYASLAISTAQKKARAAGVTVVLRVADVIRLDELTGPFDFILDLGCFHSLNGIEKNGYLDQINHLISESGHWLLYGFIKTLQNESGPGLMPNDVEKILSSFKLISRKDGLDRRDRASAYFLFGKK
jgi:2-polyprenyl-3-methyl-5-hydroxy-6-metoxy-1,4-benzoquinol methylase